MDRSLVRTAALSIALVTVITAPVGARELPRAPRGGTVTVNMRDDRFAPRAITVDRGTTVQWVNRGNNSHTSTANGGAWNSGTLDPGESFSRRFRRAGTFAYHCNVHPFMTGSVTVT